MQTIKFKFIQDKCKFEKSTRDYALHLLSHLEASNFEIDVRIDHVPFVKEKIIFKFDSIYTVELEVMKIVSNPIIKYSFEDKDNICINDIIVEVIIPDLSSGQYFVV